MYLLSTRKIYINLLYMFSLKSGKPIAIIMDGKNNGRLIYLKDDMSSNVKLNIPDSSPLSYIRNDLNHLANDTSDEITIEDEGKLYPLPSIKHEDPDRNFIGGPSGSGKTMYLRNLVIALQELKPKIKIVLFSRKDKDDKLDEVVDPKNRIKVDNTILEYNFTAEDIPKYKNSLFIFDDIDSNMSHDKKVTDHIRSFRDLLLDKGRDQDIYIMTTSHNLTDGDNTKTSIMESTSITFFPYGGDRAHAERILKVYCGLKTDMINKIFSLNTRWVTIFKRYPFYCMYEKGVFLLNNNIKQ